MRTPITHSVRGSDGAVREDADVYVRVRYFNVNTNVYAAATGGSPVSQPLTPNPDGTVSGWVDIGTPLDIVEDFNGRETRYEWDPTTFAVDAWTAPTLINSWANAAAPDGPAGYRKYSTNVVAIRGRITTGTLGTAAFVLPAGFRPANTLAFTTESNGVVGRVDVYANGNVIPAVGGTSSALDGIHFEAQA